MRVLIIPINLISFALSRYLNLSHTSCFLASNFSLSIYLSLSLSFPNPQPFFLCINTYQNSSTAKKSQREKERKRKLKLKPKPEIEGEKNHKKRSKTFRSARPMFVSGTYHFLPPPFIFFSGFFCGFCGFIFGLRLLSFLGRGCVWFVIQGFDAEL